MSQKYKLFLQVKLAIIELHIMNLEIMKSSKQHQVLSHTDEAKRELQTTGRKNGHLMHVQTQGAPHRPLPWEWF